MFGWHSRSSGRKSFPAGAPLTCVPRGLMSAHPTACPECGAQMLLVRILPDRPGYEKRTYACPWCPQQEVTEVLLRE